VNGSTAPTVNPDIEAEWLERARWIEDRVDHYLGKGFELDEAHREATVESYKIFGRPNPLARYVEQMRKAHGLGQEAFDTVAAWVLVYNKLLARRDKRTLGVRHGELAEALERAIVEMRDEILYGFPLPSLWTAIPTDKVRFDNYPVGVPLRVNGSVCIKKARP